MWDRVVLSSRLDLVRIYIVCGAIAQFLQCIVCASGHQPKNKSTSSTWCGATAQNIFQCLCVVGHQPKSQQVGQSLESSNLGNRSDLLCAAIAQNQFTGQSPTELRAMAQHSYVGQSPKKYQWGNRPKPSYSGAIAQNLLIVGQSPKSYWGNRSLNMPGQQPQSGQSYSTSGESLYEDSYHISILYLFTWTIKK